MERSKFDEIISNQVKVTEAKDIVKYYKKIGRVCGFLNLRGYDDSECVITPVIERGEILLMEGKGDEYSEHIKVKDPLDGSGGGWQVGKFYKWYGVNGDYFIKNLGDDCHTVYKLNASVIRGRKLKELGI